MVERHEPWQPAPPARDRAGRVAQRADQAATRALGWLMRLAEQAAAHRSAGARHPTGRLPAGLPPAGRPAAAPEGAGGSWRAVPSPPPAAEAAQPNAAAPTAETAVPAAETAAPAAEAAAPAAAGAGTTGAGTTAAGRAGGGVGTPGSTTPPREAITVERPAAAPPGQAEQQRLRPARPAVGYALHGGEADAHRLATQARALEATTAEFLTAAGLRPGWRCLDVGCGHGQVSLLLATRVRPGGRVVGIDGDAASLRVARRSAADAGAAVTFLRADAGSLPARRGRFDLAYTRLLLSHLVDPLEALRAMTTAVRPGGVVAVEDVHIDWLGLIRALPALWGGGAGGRADPVLLEFAELIDTVIRSRGGDPAIGPRLPALLTAAGLTDITAAVRPLPIPADPSGTIVAAMVDAIRDTAISAGLTDAARLDRMRTALRQLPAEYTEVSRRIARLYQVSGRRPRPRGTPAYGDEPAAWPAEPGQPTWPADAWSASAA